MSKAEKKYTRDLLLVMLCFVGITYVSIWSLDHYEFAGFRWLIALTPMVPLYVAWRVIINFVRALDELQRRIQLEATVFSVTVSGFLAQGYAFLQRSAGVPEIDIGWVLPLLLVTWSIGGFLARRRYL